MSDADQLTLALLIFLAVSFVLWTLHERGLQRARREQELREGGARHAAE